eukprot:s533_g4.t1
MCVPFTAWHRLKQSRMLKAALTKPSVVRHGSLGRSSRGALARGKLHEGVDRFDHTRIVVEHVHWDEDPSVGECVFTLDGVQGYVPYAKSLADVASEHFSFLSAESAAPQRADESGSQKLDSRMDRLELVVEGLSTSLQTFLSQQHPYPDLDPGVVEAALAAGVEKTLLEQMQALVNKGMKKTLKLPDPFAGKLSNPSSESEGEVAEGDESGSGLNFFGPRCSCTGEVDGDSWCACGKESLCFKTGSWSGFCTWKSKRHLVGSGKRSAAAWRALRVTMLP